MKATQLLMVDHEQVTAMLDALASGGDLEASGVAFFWKIKDALELHTEIEETIFYPAVGQTDELKDMVLESLEEHKQVKTLLREMENLTSDSEKFEPKLKVLMENVEHHAEEEEEGKMFSKIRKLMSTEKLERLGEELEAAKGKGSRAA